MGDRNTEGLRVHSGVPKNHGRARHNKDIWGIREGFCEVFK